jgi:hypothetical protein
MSMNTTTDRLYNLLPVVHRMRDEELGWPLRALLGVISEQVNLVEEDITQLYENWFIETCRDWLVPYIGDLVGYQLVHEAGEPGDAAGEQGQARTRILIPRLDVADTIRNRRRKGTLALLEALAGDVAGWPARAVEFYSLLARTQHINHLRLARGRTVDVRDGSVLDRLDSPFDSLAHTVDVRRIASARKPGLYNIPSTGLFLWRLKAYSVTKTRAYPVEEVGPNCYTFSPLGNDAPLFHHPGEQGGAWNLPMPITRRAFEQYLTDFYGEGKSLAVYASWGAPETTQALAAEQIIAADLSDWEAYNPAPGFVAVDPALGRIVFPSGQLPRKNVRVSYHYGFSANMGGGEYLRPLRQPPDARLYLVGENQPMKKIADALNRWQGEQLPNAVIEITDSGIYVEQIEVELQENQSLQIRASSGKRPIIRLQDWQTDQPDSLTVRMRKGSRITLDGLLIAGRAVHVRGERMEDLRGPICSAAVTLRHCTLVPGRTIKSSYNRKRPVESSLELYGVRAQVSIEHCILGAIQVSEDQVKTDPIPLRISDSILDATGSEREALGAPGYGVAHVVLTVLRSTVFGIVEVHAITLAENSIFNDCLNVARRQLGCLRFCYIPETCRSPWRYRCQPETAEQLAEEAALNNLIAARQAETPPASPTPAEIAAAQEQARHIARERVRPAYTDRAYGQPGYAQLADFCPPEIKRGAEDESEMGAFHDLFQPQREANLRARLEEFTPAGMHAGLIFVS